MTPLCSKNGKWARGEQQPSIALLKKMSFPPHLSQHCLRFDGILDAKAYKVLTAADFRSLSPALIGGVGSLSPRRRYVERPFRARLGLSLASVY